MQPQKLITMANQIGAFFEAEPDPERAQAGVADHLRRFWDPRMRRELLAWLEAHGDEALRPLVRQAIAAHRERLRPAPATP
ncbi:MAG: formate dehydrogenase subunit delta [Kofleriaceae bacterium]